eukprot:CAMPEP_0179854120 /NCGR_PEP_ID=MMETSP0982-20121206/9740_1 /TAXON_ID=483367 /ORGANISM="non described non described, Strain CCMP 2436" /LENGTH=98 /DNA_ID=CAMNT_0021739937 /DNA_START=90 /DNA_END=386 /DNA_ORIENTATION=-
MWAAPLRAARAIAGSSSLRWSTSRAVITYGGHADMRLMGVVRALVLNMQVKMGPRGPRRARLAADGLDGLLIIGEPKDRAAYLHACPSQAAGARRCSA